MLKLNIFTCAVLCTTALPSSVNAEGGCPKGTFPAGGGYCRNIVCDTSQRYIPGWGNRAGYYIGNGANDPDAIETLEKYNLSYSAGLTKWGQTYIPMR